MFSLFSGGAAGKEDDEGVKDGAAVVGVAVVEFWGDQGGGNAGGVDAVGLGNVGGGGIVSEFDFCSGEFSVWVCRGGHKLILILARTLRM